MNAAAKIVFGFETDVVEGPAGMTAKCRKIVARIEDAGGQLKEAIRQRKPINTTRFYSQIIERFGAENGYPSVVAVWPSGNQTSYVLGGDVPSYQVAGNEPVEPNNAPVETIELLKTMMRTQRVFIKRDGRGRVSSLVPSDDYAFDRVAEILVQPNRLDPKDGRTWARGLVESIDGPIMSQFELTKEECETLGLQHGPSNKPAEPWQK